MRTKRIRRMVLALFLAALMAPWAARAAGPAVTDAPVKAQDEGWETAAPDESAAPTEEGISEEGTEEDGASEDAASDGGDAATSDGGDAAASGADTSSIVNNRTSSEQLNVSETEQKYLAALHTEVASETLSIQASIGYGGVLAYGHPMPVEVTLRNDGGDLDGMVAVNLYRTNTYYDRIVYPLFLPSGAERQVRFYVTPTMIQGVFTIEFASAGKTVASVNVTPSKTIAPGTCLVGALSENPSALNYLTINDKNDQLLRGEYFQAVPLTVEGFPGTLEALNAFGVLAVDGADLSTLGDEQKQAFDAWLKAGGIALVGGGAQAATDYPFFESYTGVRAGELYQAEDISPALLDALGETGEALGEGSLLTRVAADANTVAKVEGGSLVDCVPVGTGAVFLASFELSARPLTDWSEIGTLWQRLMLKYASTPYTRFFAGSDTSYDYYAAQVLGGMPVKTAPGARAMVIWVLGGFVVVSGILMYLLLKKLDRRELLWLTMPVFALATSFLIFRIGIGGDAAQPITASYTVARLDKNGAGNLTTAVGAATASKDAVTLSAGVDVTLIPVEQNEFMDNYYDNTTFIKVPSKQRYIRTLGAQNSVTLPAAAAWTMNVLSTSDSRAFVGTIPATVWMEDDGLHGHVKNDTAYPLSGCVMISNGGYADLGDLAPGGEADFALLNLTDEEAKQFSQLQNNSDMYYYVPEGRNIGGNPNAKNWYTGIDAIVNAAFYPEYRIPDAAKSAAARAALSNDEVQARSLRMNLVQSSSERWMYNQETTFAFHVIGFSDQIGSMAFTMDGAPVSRQAHMAIVDAEIAFQPVGPTGLAYYPMSLLKAHIAEGSGDTPVMLGETQPNGYFRVTAEPIFGFTIPDAGKLSGLSVSIQSNFYDDPPAMALYNWKKGDWDTGIKTVITMEGDALAPYLSADGSIFMRYTQGAKNNSYQEIMAPTISASGRYQQ